MRDKPNPFDPSSRYCDRPSSPGEMSDVLLASHPCFEDLPSRLPVHKYMCIRARPRAFVECEPERQIRPPAPGGPKAVTKLYFMFGLVSRNTSLVLDYKYSHPLFILLAEGFPPATNGTKSRDDDGRVSNSGFA